MGPSPSYLLATCTFPPFSSLCLLFLVSLGLYARTIASSSAPLLLQSCLFSAQVSLFFISEDHLSTNSEQPWTLLHSLQQTLSWLFLSHHSLCVASHCAVDIRATLRKPFVIPRRVKWS